MPDNMAKAMSEQKQKHTRRHKYAFRDALLSDNLRHLQLQGERLHIEQNPQSVEPEKL